MKFIGLWILNHLKTSGGQPVALGALVCGLEVNFLARLIIFVFVDFRIFCAELATHCHSRGSSPNYMLHLQFWDGALLPPGVLGGKKSLPGRVSGPKKEPNGSKI